MRCGRPPLGVAFVFGETAQKDYDLALLITAAAGTGLLLATRRYRRELLPRDGFLLVTLCWTVLPGFAAAHERLRVHAQASADLSLAAGCTPRTAALIRAQAHPVDGAGARLQLADEGA